MPQYSLASSTWGLQEIEAIQRVIKTGNFTMGENVRKYEKVFAKKFGARFGVMLNSGSSANLALLTACRYSMTNSIKEGDEVIVPAVSWSTTYYPVSQIGAKLKFVDVNRYSLNIEIEEIKKAINRNTKAIFAVNLLGNPAEWLAMQNLAEEHGLILLEDNCESLGAKAYGKNSGTFGLARSVQLGLMILVRVGACGCARAVDVGDGQLGEFKRVLVVVGPFSTFHA
jgi:CDP-6-deoxy-D-xylo-4-hexulose-3-dehydrase